MRASSASRTACTYGLINGVDGEADVAGGPPPLGDDDAGVRDGGRASSDADAGVAEAEGVVAA